jgi:hypothetical protein
MPAKIVQEVTEWSGIEYRQPNHVYLMDGDKAFAYVPWGKGRPFYFKTFQRIDRRGRKFVEVKSNRWKFDFSVVAKSEELEKPRGETWTVAGSKGNQYTVSLSAGQWSCTCPGHGFRNHCRHVDEMKETHHE